MNPKPGYRTTEFWISLVSQVLALLTILGLVAAEDAQTLEEALSKCVAAVFLFAANAWIVVQYIKGRVALKGEPKSGSRPTILPLLLIAALALGAMGSPVQAQPLLPWRAQIEQRLRDQQQLIQHLLAQRQAPAPILLQPLPIPGEPKQQVPIEGEPRQQLPIPGEPKQQLPVPGEPKQPLPIDGPPKQVLPVPGPVPQQPLPVQPPGVHVPQSYTVRIRALYRTEEK